MTHINANPTSMNAAIDTLLSSPRKHKYAVVGTMAELEALVKKLIGKLVP